MKITFLPGDGVGPEICRAAAGILHALNASSGSKFEIVEEQIGGAAIRSTGSPLPESTLKACLASDAVFVGAVGAPGFENLSREQKPEAGLLRLRNELGGFANLRPAIYFEAIAECSPLRQSRIEGADVLVVRELLGGLFFSEPRGFGQNRDYAFNTMRYSIAEIERIARVGFEQARLRRKRLTSVDKANVLETSQLWRRVVTEMGKLYPDVSLEHAYVDACALHLISKPKRFDVILTENLFGDILSDEAAAISGSMGMLGSATIGGNINIYEPVHGSSPDIAGKDVANPLGAIASVAMLLRYSAGMPQEAAALEAAIQHVLDAGHRTLDISGAETQTQKTVGTEEMGRLVEQAFLAMLDQRSRTMTHG
jgi:3-isopropylmalate dehydrogenase